MGRRFSPRRKAAVKALDPTRPTTGAVNGGFTKQGYISVEDILGMNYHNREFDRNHRVFPGLMIFGSEDLNAKSSRGSMETSPRDRPLLPIRRWPRAGLSRRAAVAILGPGGRARYVAGEFIWTGFDYRGEPNPFSWPAVTSQTGAMDLCGFSKPVYYYWQAAWKEEPSVYVFPDWNLPDSDGGKKRPRARHSPTASALTFRSTGRASGAGDAAQRLP